jgi:hypothetical protein
MGFPSKFGVSLCVSIAPATKSAYCNLQYFSTITDKYYHKVSAFGILQQLADFSLLKYKHFIFPSPVPEQHVKADLDLLLPHPFIFIV